ncbi:uncharacterized protein LOC143532180 [Bidens hawaiensis]|uniref:uncharacterized protein LOC143532180 n=1 Tax=Bidens hawaiensis TaxID=980011 RepID=UPI00404A58D1
MGGKVDSSINKDNAPFIFRLSGENYHSIGSLLLTSGSKPKFSQLYIYDTDNEIANRQGALGQTKNVSTSSSEILDLEIIQDLKAMLDLHNQLVKSYRMARDCFQSNPNANLKLRLIAKRQQDGRTYNLPTASEVAALIFGDIDNSFEPRDIIVKTKEGFLQRISELHPSYLPLQYLIIFIYGDDGYILDILHRNRLFQQFLVDAYTMIESERLFYIRNQQKKLRCETFENLRLVKDQGKIYVSKIGQRVVLPSSFTGSAQYMLQNYLDAMSLCKWYGFPDFFITITCNPKWPEVKRFLEDTTLKPEDRPDILCRLFKIKLDSMIKDIRDNAIIGKVQAESVSRPEFVWESTWTYLSDDILYKQRVLLKHPDLLLDEEQIKNLTLFEIEKFLLRNNYSLKRFSTVSFPDHDCICSANNLLLSEELAYDKVILGKEFCQLLSSLTDEQRHIYEEIMTTVDKKKRGVFFVYGFGGTGKTYLWKTLCASIRSEGKIVLSVASSGIASLLLSGGRTAHSRSEGKIVLVEDSFCFIKPDSDLAS